MKFFAPLLALLLLFPGLNLNGQGFSSVGQINKDGLIGLLVSQMLESQHYKKIFVDDSLSEKAFKKYLEQVDYTKQFLLKKDVEKLKKYKFNMDDQMKTGQHELNKLAQGILQERVKQSEAYRKEFFKKKFTFKAKESMEFDPEKRDYPRTEKARKDLWRRVFKQATLSSYASLLDDQLDEIEAREKKKKEKKKEKKKKSEKKAKKEEKILSDKELLVKAHESVSKKYKRYFERLLKEEKSDYLEKFYNAITYIFDPHTQYLPPKKREDFDIDISGSLEGIGAVLQEDGPHIKVNKVVPGGAAWRQKELEVDDVILEVHDPKHPERGYVSLVDMRVDNAVRYIRGPKGTQVWLRVKKADGSKKVIKIVRDVVQVDESFAKSSVIQHKDIKLKVGYIFVPKFYRDFQDGSKKNCTDDVRNELRRLKKLKVDAIVLDLRNNGGGALIDATRMSGLFIKKGPIVQVRDQEERIEILKDRDPSVEWDGPLVVMINRISASATEILAGALQDYKRAVIVGGAHTHGKGTVQVLMNLNQPPLTTRFGNTIGALKLTIQKFYRVSGGSTQFKGVTPDIALPDPLAYTESREQDLDYSLVWDTIKPVPIKKWENFPFKISKLKKESSKRVKKNKRFKKITDSVNYLISRRKDTKIPLNFKEYKKREKESHDMAKKFKFDDDDINKDIIVSDYESSLKANEHIRKGDEKKWKEDFKQRKEEWVKSLQRDPQIEETIYILNDMMKQLGKNSVSMRK